MKYTYSILASLALAASSFAGTEMSSKDYKAPAPEPCFADTELQLDVFGSYTWNTDGNHGDGFGGGLGLSYFFHRNFGLNVTGSLRDGDYSGIWNVDFDLVARFPIEGGVCIAPYILAGGGLETNGTTVGTWNVGGGLEWRATPSIGIFTEGRYTWGGADEDSATVRAGLRFVF
jgi:opacity protein-like surface antigen